MRKPVQIFSNLVTETGLKYDESVWEKENKIIEKENDDTYNI